jgi:hypothetical protein
LNHDANLMYLTVKSARENRRFAVWSKAKTRERYGR